MLRPWGIFLVTSFVALTLIVIVDGNQQSFMRQFAQEFNQPLRVPLSGPGEYMDSFSTQPRDRRQPVQAQARNHPQGRSPKEEYDEDGEYCQRNNPKWNKKFILRVYREVIANKETANLDKYFSLTYIQHNPAVGDGVEALLAALSFDGVLAGEPQPVNLLHIAADGDLVWMHHWKIGASGGTFLHVDIFRVECGKIAEHWDVIQPFDRSQPSLNDHPFF